MTVKLAVEITSPLSPDDRDLLAGIAVMTLAIANRELNQPEAAVEEPEPQPCGDLEMLTYPPKTVPEATGRVCVSDVGHKGRHKYRDPDITFINIGSMNPEGMN